MRISSITTCGQCPGAKSAVSPAQTALTKTCAPGVSSPRSTGTTARPANIRLLFGGVSTLSPVRGVSLRQIMVDRSVSLFSRQPPGWSGVCSCGW
ncbi:Uncharacterised protein [Shimwellia blattae]|nr:Uncharacterised protein [Shimwellia blattae]VEC22788.1 Uncharacterised protein [Shimwellia blattae]